MADLDRATLAAAVRDADAIRNTALVRLPPPQTETEEALREILARSVRPPTSDGPVPRKQLPAVENAFTAKRVLLVEDNIINQRVGTALLERLGCHVDVAANGIEAVEMAAQLRYDVVFMDCQMPEMDGYEATAAIRRREGLDRRTPILAMTANAMPGDRERCIAAGMDGYIPTPISLEAIRGALAALPESAKPVTRLQ